MSLRKVAKVETQKKTKVNQETMTKTLNVYLKITTPGSTAPEAKVTVLFPFRRVFMCAIRTDESCVVKQLTTQGKSQKNKKENGTVIQELKCAQLLLHRCFERCNKAVTS